MRTLAIYVHYSHYHHQCGPYHISTIIHETYDYPTWLFCNLHLWKQSTLYSSFPRFHSPCLWPFALSCHTDCILQSPLTFPYPATTTSLSWVSSCLGGTPLQRPSEISGQSPFTGSLPFLFHCVTDMGLWPLVSWHSETRIHVRWYSTTIIWHIVLFLILGLVEWMSIYLAPGPTPTKVPKALARLISGIRSCMCLLYNARSRLEEAYVLRYVEILRSSPASQAPDNAGIRCWIPSLLSSNSSILSS